MVGNKENNAILEALKHLFQHFSSAFSACCLNRRRKIEKGLFILIQNRRPTPCSTRLQQPYTCILKSFLTVTAKSFVPLFRRKKQIFTNCVHGYEHERNVRARDVICTQKFVHVCQFVFFFFLPCPWIILSSITTCVGHKL